MVKYVTAMRPLLLLARTFQLSKSPFHIFLHFSLLLSSTPRHLFHQPGTTATSFLNFLFPGKSNVLPHAPICLTEPFPSHSAGCTSLPGGKSSIDRDCSGKDCCLLGPSLRWGRVFEPLVTSGMTYHYEMVIAGKEKDWGVFVTLCSVE